MVDTAPPIDIWLARQLASGDRALRAIATQRRLLGEERDGLDRFKLRMEIVELTGAISRWASAVQRGLAHIGDTEAASEFAVAPPFADAEPTPLDLDRLAGYVEDRLDVLRGQLARFRR